jgi:hypothetical protein
MDNKKYTVKRGEKDCEEAATGFDLLSSPLPRPAHSEEICDDEEAKIDWGFNVSESNSLDEEDEENDGDFEEEGTHQIHDTAQKGSTINVSLSIRRLMDALTKGKFPNSVAWVNALNRDGRMLKPSPLTEPTSRPLQVHIFIAKNAQETCAGRACMGSNEFTSNGWTR